MRRYLIICLIILLISSMAGCADSQAGNTAGNVINAGIVAQQGKWIYYSNSNDQFKLYRMDTKGSSNTKITDDEGTYINVLNDWVFCSDVGTNQIYRINRTDGQRADVN